MTKFGEFRSALGDLQRRRSK